MSLDVDFLLIKFLIKIDFELVFAFQFKILHINLSNIFQIKRFLTEEIREFFFF